MAWGEYQKMLVEGVNELVGGMFSGCGSGLEVREVRGKRGRDGRKAYHAIGLVDYSGRPEEL